MCEETVQGARPTRVSGVARGLHTWRGRRGRRFINEANGMANDAFVMNCVELVGAPAAREASPEIC